MATLEIKLPKMGESIKEATALKWLKQVGDVVEKDDPILEVATDKVDSELAAPEGGVITEILFAENDVIPVGTVIAKMDTSSSVATSTTKETKVEEKLSIAEETINSKSDSQRFDDEGRFYSPLVRSMAEKEGVSFEELKTIPGSGQNGRVLKNDLLTFIEPGSKGGLSQQSNYEGGQQIIEMDRMRSMIADHMVHSKQTSPHVTAYIEADVTKMVKWREKNKFAFQEKYGEKITYTPIFVEAVVKAIQEFPLINVSVDGKKIIVKSSINIGLAAALPSGNLIVPVIKNADQKNMLGLAKETNSLVQKARTNKLKADDIKGGTFTISNVGTFRNLMGTPIINQPEVAILATGSINKRAVVVTQDGEDVIAIRSMIYLSLSFDHRVVDGNLGGSFLARIGDFLEEFDSNRIV
ncbi:2-oxo acid dehydrogenase subunit E2 [Vicingaceae bacterium]|nr:2-oxo acid dehydrogenase subunit E2 [Vicingaceae bacterium]MDB4062221.1 2-oxo acid dehydrogenase subunit E2 [Vicingaceae bacterium]MDB4083089.1 2-oxo acid dehydrogenase subunit E2 [Vicingaceae bacterium]MDC1452508.1 2-oxo acid dehydrogenase subunit E2 [Vicingaceae bacterium]